MLPRAARVARVCRPANGLTSVTLESVLTPPDLRQRSRELLVGRDVVGSVLKSWRLLGAPRGDGRPVLLITGFGGTDPTLYPLREFLRRLGHDARSARLGRISDDVEGLYPLVAERARQLAGSVGRPVALVGWSIGGVLAREAARDAPDVIDQVVTFGTPVEGGPSYTALSRMYSEERLADIRAQVDERAATPIEVPVTAIWSRNDGVVNPRACIDWRTRDVEHVEVRASHVGMGFDHDVWVTVADRLAA